MSVPRSFRLLTTGVVAFALVVVLFRLVRDPVHRARGEVAPRPPGHGTVAVPEEFAGVRLYPGRKRDEIPAVDRPEFAGEPVPVGALADDDRVIGVCRNGVERAYPLWVLRGREIINDRIGSEPVCVTYCPFSDSALVFSSRVGDRELTFGNEGALYECNLVLYDRETGSLWYQLRGEALGGALKGRVLQVLPSAVARWGDWRRLHPDGEVLIGDQKSGRFFRVMRAGGVDEAVEPSAPAAPVSRMDGRLPAMARVVGFGRAGVAACLPAVDVAGLADGQHRIPGMPGALLVSGGGLSVAMVDVGGGAVPGVGAYWFAWHAAYPAGSLVVPRP